MRVFSQFLPILPKIVNYPIPIATLVLIISLLVTIWGWISVKQFNQHYLENTLFNYKVEDLKKALTSQMLTYQKMLQEIANLRVISPTMKPREWENYINNLPLEHHPSLKHLGFVHPIATDTSQLKNTQTIKLLSNSQSLLSHSQLKLMVETNMWEDPLKRAAMERARDTGKPALSTQINLPHATFDPKPLGFILYVPVYQDELLQNTPEERQMALLGYVYGIFDTHELIAELLTDIPNQQIQLHIDDNLSATPSSTHSVLKPNNYSSSMTQASMTKLDTLVIAGHSWKLYFSASSDFSVITQNYISDLVLFGGLVSSFLLFGITRSLEIKRHSIIKQQRNQLQIENDQRCLAEATSKQLGTELNEVRRIAKLGNWSLDIATQHVFWTGELYQIFGLDPNLPPPDYNLHHQLFVPESWQRLTHHLTHTLKTGDPYELELEFIKFNQTRGWMLVRGEVVRNDQGNIVKLQGMAQDITERKLAEKCLIQNEERFNLAMQGSNDGLWDWNLINNEVYFSPRWKSMLGYNDLELPNRFIEWQQRIHPEDIEQVFFKINYYLQEKTPYFEALFRMQHKLGHWMWILGRGVAIWNAENKPVRMVGTHTDLTILKKTEEALRGSEERFDLAMRGSNDGLWDWNLRTNEVYFSPRWKEMLGYLDHEVPHSLNEWTKRVHPDDFEQVIVEVNAYLERKTPDYKNLHRLQHKDGSYLWILDRGVAVWNTAGKAIRMVGTHTDLTALKQAEEALKKSEETYRYIVETAQEGIWVIDAQAKTTYVNTRMAEMLGYSEAEILGTSPLDFVNETYREEAKRYLEYHQQGRGKIQDFCLQRRDGKELWVIVSTTVLLDKLGEFSGILGMITDITQRKQMESELKQAKEKAEMANQAKSMFLANMSHELRNSLNGILGYAQILGRDMHLNQGQKEEVKAIEKGGEYLLSLINDILDLAKIEAGRIELFPSIIRLENFLSDITQPFQLRAQEKGIEFVCQYLYKLPSVIEVDETRLSQILINLLSNAFKFTEQGKITFKVAYTDKKLHFKVQDQGCGIAPADLKKLFLPFQQMGNKKHRYQGAGLGLAISKRLVEMMGGELKVDSILGEGSVFELLIPLSQLPETSNPNPNSEENHFLEIIGYQGDPRTILIIDDDDMSRHILMKFLGDLGFIVLEASKGQIGLEKAQIMPILDLILVDLIMPDLDGFSVIRQIRQLPHHQNTRLIVVSGSAFEMDRQKSAEVGGNDFL